jgi:release factor glutamine methyltransferase
VSEDRIVARLRAAGCVFAEDEAVLLVGAAETPDELERMVGERVGGRPLEQILGWAEFGGIRVVVEPGVFVPRRRSELVVRLAAESAAAGAVAVDLCCGSGALGAALLAARPDLEVYAADIDPAAVACARRNLPAERVHEGDLYDALPDRLRGRVGVLLVNAPYVPTEAIAMMPPEARDHEHRVALDGGSDGLDVQRGVCAGAAEWLGPGGSVVIETGRSQADTTAALMAAAGLVPRVVTDPEIGAVAVAGKPHES